MTVTCEVTVMFLIVANFRRSQHDPSDRPRWWKWTDSIARSDGISI